MEYKHNGAYHKPPHHEPIHHYDHEVYPELDPMCGVVGYGKRGRRGKQGLQGEPGPEGKPGRVQDVIVNSEASVVDSEGIAWINIPECIIGKEVTVTEKIGGYEAGDVITADTPLKDIVEKILNFEQPLPPQPEFDLMTFAGVLMTVPTGIDQSWGGKPWNSKPASIVEYFTVNKGYEGIAYPAEWGPLSKINENDLPFNLISVFKSFTTEKDGKQYLLYYGIDPVKETNAKYEFFF